MWDYATFGVIFMLRLILPGKRFASTRCWKQHVFRNFVICHIIGTVDFTIKLVTNYRNCCGGVKKFLTEKAKSFGEKISDKFESLYWKNTSIVKKL